MAKRYSDRVRALIIGCGYVGEALGQRLIALDHEVTGIRRSSQHNNRLAKLGIRPLNLDITQEREFEKLDAHYDQVVIAVSPGRGDNEAYQKVFGLGVNHITKWLQRNAPTSVVFISSTSVYRQKNAEWVQEDIADIPENITSKILWEAEQKISTIEQAVTILRSSGIYGPGRSHLFRQFMDGNATIEGNGDRYLNMVHRDDLAEAITHSITNKDKLCGTFNITDDEPVKQLAFFKWLSKTTNRPMPAFGPEPDPTTRKRGITNKRVSNKLFKEILGFQYNYPTFREGLIEELENWKAMP